MKRIPVDLRLHDDQIALLKLVAKNAGVKLNDVICVVLAFAIMGAQRHIPPKAKPRRKRK